MLKCLVLRNIFIFNNKIHSVKVSHFSVVKKFISFLETKKYIFDPKLLRANVLNEYVEVNFTNLSQRTKQTKLFCLKGFINEIEHSGVELNYDRFEPIWNLVDRKIISAEKKANKKPSIPKTLLKKIEEKALIDIEDEFLNLPQRACACMILIMSNTGIRVGELALLEANRLKEISIFNGKKSACYLEFLTYKTTSNKSGKWTETIANESVIKAYRKWEEITEEKRVKLDSKWLNINGTTGRRYTADTIRSNIQTFFFRHQKKLGISRLNDIEKTQLQKTTPKSKIVSSGRTTIHIKRKDFDTEFYYVNPHQFRVSIANILKDKGVQLQWIKRHMNHLEEEMTIHYFRDDELLKKTLFSRANLEGDELDIEREKRIEEDIEKTDFELKDAYAKINKFLKNKKLNVFNNIDDIINVFQNSSLRDTSVGLCTKSMGILCERQSRLETLEKWFYVSPQIPDIGSFDFTYNRFKEKVKIVKHNKDLYNKFAKYERQYNIELNALTKYYHNCFKMEFNMLKRLLDEQPADSVIKTYPNLHEIVNRFKEVEKEVEVWAKEVK